MSALRDRAAALAGELVLLKREAALTADQELNQRLKEVRRILKPLTGGKPFSEDSYDRLRADLIEELYSSADTDEHAIQARKDSLRAEVRATVEAEQEAERAELQARENQAAEREAAVTERERQAQPSYRARFAAAGAGLVLAADVLIRVVA